MERLTRTKDEYECRIAGGCPAEEWIDEHLGLGLAEAKEEVCLNCPFEKYINKLAEYEDCLEKATKYIKLAKEIIK